ncbi:gp53-like domain-containing protein [Burkholderia contaminans]|uniref:gp53-like domain-containing protein n=1 Tax=Burkholderia contaminans TaxID=488447 RepID=UPI0014543448|nr:hypothetical protein [Burkholderia contaminans]VWD20978.1 hypothetical protein BCO18442_03915 [Burkholderia contaminans]
MPSLFTFANNISTTLAGSISSGATSLTLSSAANLPASIPAGKVLVITLNDVATRQQFEVIYATAISGATLSGLLRAQEGTSAQAWATGAYAYCSPTMGQMQAFGQLGDNNTWGGNNTFNAPVVIAPAVSGSTSQAVNQGQFGSFISTNGYKKVPDPNSPTGYFIEQWGTLSGTNGASVTFPIAFPNACLNVTVSEAAATSGSWGSGSPTVHASGNPTATGFIHWTLAWQQSTGSWINASNTFSYTAKGY